MRLVDEEARQPPGLAVGKGEGRLAASRYAGEIAVSAMRRRSILSPEPDVQRTSSTECNPQERELQSVAVIARPEQVTCG